jgi:CRISPR-associated protein Cmr5
MTLQTNSQKMAQKAYETIRVRVPSPEFRSFARAFPSLIHSCGLAQAVAFAKAKKRDEFLLDLTEVLKVAGYGQLSDLGKATRDLDVTTYVRLSRHALQAASWLKRYVEADEEA